MTKLISASELTQESLQLAKKYKELNCFVTMNEELGAKNANSIDLDNESNFDACRNPFGTKRFILHRRSKNNMFIKNTL